MPGAQVSPAQAEALLAALDRQAQAYRLLLALSGRKQEVLVRGEVEALARLLPDEQAALAGLQRLEVEVAQGVSALAGAAGLSPRDDLVALAAALPEPWRGQIDAHRAQLAGLAEGLALLVQSNGELIRRARAYIEFSLHQAARAAGDTGYGSDGSRRLALGLPAAGPRY